MTFLLFSYLPCSAQEQAEGIAESDTYSISLVQTATMEKNQEIIEVEDKKVLAENYSIKDGEYLWKILRERGLLEKSKLKEVLSMLAKLNPAMSDLDLIHPGQTIMIPLVITPVASHRTPAVMTGDAPLPVTAEKFAELDLESEGYTIQAGDSLIKVVKNKFEMSDKELHSEYMDLLKKLNPSINNLNLVYPGQKVRLPIFASRKIRKPIANKISKTLDQPASVRERTGQEVISVEAARSDRLNGLADQLGDIFTMIGEEWIQTGEHYIPLKTGGQINLKAESYPVLSLKNGKMLIIDLNNDLPVNMVELITKTWAKYRIIHLEKDNDLRTAVNRILPMCDYFRLYSNEEPFVLNGNIPLRITADRIIQKSAGDPGKDTGLIALNILEKTDSRLSGNIREFLDAQGITAIEYPFIEDRETPVEADILEPGSNISALVEELIILADRTFTKKMEISVFQKQKKDFNLIVVADYYLNINGRDCIIDLNGLGSDIIDLLEEHNFRVLPLSGDKNSSEIATKLLGFMGVEHDYKSHRFLAADRDEAQNISLMITGTIFQTADGDSILATQLSLPQEIEGFLAQKGYRVLRLTI